MPSHISTIEEAERLLLSYSPVKQSGETYSLGRMKRLMELLGNPQDDIPAIHVAGTSGKTSTANYIRALLEARDVRVGLITSPHIDSIAERIQVDGAPLDPKRFVSYLNRFLVIIDPWDDVRPTYFELLTAFAFWVFKQQRLDYMVIEVGLGGLLDATNVISNKTKVSVITPIGLDHTEILGETVGEIASQKAGIINADSDIFTGPQDMDAKKSIERIAMGKQARVHAVLPRTTDLPDVPLFQQDNFHLAHQVTTFIAVRDDLKSIEESILQPLIHSTPPGRFEVYMVGGKMIILDGAHNPQKLAAFTTSLGRMYDGPFAWMVGFIEAPDTKIEECVSMIANTSDTFIATQFSVGQDIKGRRSIAAVDVESKFSARGASVRSVTSPTAALEELLQSKQRTLVVTGSLYMVAIVRRTISELATLSSAE